MSTEQDITNNIQAINPNLEKLKQAFPHCFDKNGDFDFAKFKAELDSSDINIAKEGYSLNWLGKSYARVLASDAATTLLKEDEVHNAKPENANSQNLLIKGDNLEVLKHLSNAYYEKVKMIYIDPPYNTGSDGFVYNDDRKFTAKQLQDLAGVSEDEAKRILEFTQSNSNSHSAWLTFMYPRLYIAKQLLKDDGVIFVSIDDNEVAQLRLLMDEVFGEENFLADLIWMNKEGGGSSDSSYFRIKHEHIVCYSKSLNDTNIIGVAISNEERYKDKDNHFNYRGPYYLQKLGMGSIQYSESLDYPITTPDNSVVYPKDNNSGKKACWRWSEKKLKWGFENDFVVIKKDSKGIWTVYTKQYLNCDNEGNLIDRTQRPFGVIENFSSTQATKLLDVMGLSGVFSYSKPIELISYLIERVSDSNDIILDFFAGSGTTAHSVMQLNKEDGGNRKFILVQLPELIDSKKSKAAYDFVKDELGVTPPTIFEITKERIIRATKKIKEENIDIPSKSEKIKCDGVHDEHCPACKGEYTIKIEATKAKDLSNQDLGFKIFETTPIWEDYDFKAEKLANAEKLFDDDKLTEADVKALFTTWKTYDGSPLTEPVQEIDLAGYKAYYTKQKLYLMHKGFSTATLKALLEHIDADATFNPTAIIAFGYYFESKALREIAENIKTYNNKKNIDIDFITRY